MLDDPHIGAMGHLGGPLRIGLAQLLHAGLQAQRIQRAEDKGSVATLRAAELADQPITGALPGLGEGENS